MKSNGTEFTDEDIERWGAEAEAGFPGAQFGESQAGSPAEAAQLKPIGSAKADELREAFADYLGEEIYSCGKVYEAWGYGTMSLEDFSLAREDDDILNSLVEIALGKLGFALPNDPSSNSQ